MDLNELLRGLAPMQEAMKQGLVKADAERAAQAFTAPPAAAR